MEAVTVRALPKAEDTAARNAVWERTRDGQDEQEAWLLRIAALPAQTAQGRAAKARIVQASIAGWGEAGPVGDSPWDAVLWSLTRDLTAGEGA
jgi:cytochrome c556